MKSKIRLFFLIGISFITLFFIKYPNNTEITLVGPVVAADGLGRNTIDFATILKENFKISIYPTSMQKEDLPTWIKPLFQKKLGCIGKIVLYIKPVWNLKKNDIEFLQKITSKKERRLIAYSMFESSLIPLNGVEILNKYFDLVVVPDPYLVQVYKDSGVTKPIEMLPLAVNFTKLKKIPLKTTKNDPFVFTILSSAIYRKNILTAVEAFSKSFKNNPHVKLIINSRYSFNGSNHEILRYIHHHQINNIQFTTKSLEENEYNKLLAQSDCFLSVSLGEGFSIQPREAMVLGIPTIVTSNTAQTTICNTGLVSAVECKVKEPAFHYFSDTPYGDYFKCSVDDLSQALEDVYYNYDYYLSNSYRAREWALKYDINVLNDTYIAFFQKNLIDSGSR